MTTNNQPKSLEEAMKSIEQWFLVNHDHHDGSECVDSDKPYVDSLVAETHFKSFLELVWHAGRESVIEDVKKHVKDNRMKVERIDRYVLDELITKLSELKEKK